MRLKRLWFLAVALGSMASGPAHAADPAAVFVTKLFMDVCVPNMGSSQGVRAWASSNHLAEVTNAALRGMFVGPGGNGAAWALATPLGSFAVSIRGLTEGCAVWARRADPADVEAYFRRLMEGVRRPGLIVQIVNDETLPSPAGRVRKIVYQMNAPPAAMGFVFILLTAERPDGPFQANIEVARANLAAK